MGGLPQTQPGTAPDISSYLASREQADAGAVREWFKAAMTTCLVPHERRRAARMFGPGSRPLLHLGCADHYLDGWVNIDLARPGRRLDLRWDLRRPLPFAGRSAEAAFAEHLLEHISLSGAFHLLQECGRVLASGGVLRIGVPDLERYVRSYLGQDSLIDDCRPQRPTRGLALSEVFFLHGHRSMYDFETLRQLCHETGFSLVRRSTFGEGLLGAATDSPNRRRETLYVEAVR